MVKNRHDLATDWPFSSLGFRVGVTLQAPESVLTMAENQRVRHSNLIGIRFDPSGRISRVIIEVGPHLDWLLLHPLKFSYDRDYCLAVWMCVYCAKQWSVCGRHMITQFKQEHSLKQTNTDINNALNVNQEQLYKLSNHSLLLSETSK